jgi:transcriptional regulator with XRE-family HTH domain
MNIGNRLKQAILLKNKSLKEFSRNSGIPYITLQQYFSGKRKPNADVLHYVSIHLNTNTDWLLTGEGSMFREEKKDRQEGPNWLTDWWLQADEACTPTGI